MDKTTPMKAKPLVNVTCKLGAKGCFEDGRCHALGRCENKIETNADRIRAMSDEELAKFIRAVECCSRYSADCGFPFCPSMEGNLCNGIKEKTYQYILDWLQSEVKGSDV